MQEVFEMIIEKLEGQIRIEENIAKKESDGHPITHQYAANCMKVIEKSVKQGAKQYNNGWIPCSERLPEKEGKYLVTLDKWNIVSFADFKNLKYNPHFNAPVIAWQPLPEPYKPKGE